MTRIKKRYGIIFLMLKLPADSVFEIFCTRKMCFDRNIKKQMIIYKIMHSITAVNRSEIFIPRVEIAAPFYRKAQPAHVEFITDFRTGLKISYRRHMNIIKCKLCADRVAVHQV